MLNRVSTRVCPHFVSIASFSTLPKRPSNPYIHYVTANFPLVKSKHPPNTPGKDIMRSLGQTWKVLPRTQKAVYERKALAEARKYDNFFRTASLQLLFEAEDKKEKKYMMKRFEDLGRLPKKPPISGYALYISRQKGDPKLSAPENLKLFAEKYQKLSEIEKTALNDKVRIMKEGYEKRMHQLLNP